MVTKTTNQLPRSSRQDRVLLGVAGGLGDYLGIDPIIIRLFFLLAALAGGVGLILYLALAAVLPSGSDQPGANPEVVDGLADTTAGLRVGMLAGLALVGVGLLVLAGQLGWLAWLRWPTLWPLLLIVLGLVLLIGRRRS